jgi:hypothetical protein
MIVRGGPVRWGPGLRVSLIAALCLGAFAAATPVAEAVDVYRSTLAGQVGSYPFGPRTGDLNGDGRVDIAVHTESEDLMSLLVQRADGEFERADVAVGCSPRGVALGDLTGDGRDDIAVGCGQTQRLALLVTRADGGFDRSVVGVGGAPGNIKIGDVNGDDLRDLAVATDAGLVLLLQRPDGSFARHTFDINGDPTSVEIADIDGQGPDDVAAAVYYDVGEEDAHVSILSWNGTGFDRRDVPTPGQLGALSIADVDGNGESDLILGAGLSATGPVLVLLQDLAGDFHPADLPPLDRYETGGPIGASDVDGDGDLDLIVTGWGSNSPLLLLVQTAPGTFDRGPELAQPGSVSFALDDVNGDGRTDLVLAGHELVGADADAVMLLLDTGRPVPPCDGQAPDIVGTTGRDLINGDGFTSEVVSGLGGPDFIYDAPTQCGGGGADDLRPAEFGDQYSRFFGGSGDDHVSPPNPSEGYFFGTVTFFGGTGNDSADTGGGDDLLRGGSGEDHFHAGLGNDRVLGGPDNDHEGGGPGDDLLMGGAGDDWLTGRQGADEATGGPGADRCRAEIKHGCES